MVGAGALLCGSFWHHLPVPSMVGPAGLEACSRHLQAGAQAWLFPAQEGFGTQREETARAGKLPEGPCEDRRELWKESKGKRESSRG